jgi:hypothetical protein
MTCKKTTPWISALKTKTKQDKREISTKDDDDECKVKRLNKIDEIEDVVELYPIAQETYYQLEGLRCL